MIILTTEIMDLVQDTYAWLVLTKSLARRASFDSNQKSFPSIETIAKDVNISKPTTIKALQYLKEIGIIEIKKVQKQGFIYRNEYFILTDKIKTVGSMKINPPVKEVDLHQSTTFTCASKSNLPVPVNEIDSNLKSNLTSSKENHKEFPFFKKISLLAEKLNIKNDPPHLTLYQKLIDKIPNNKLDGYLDYLINNFDNPKFKPKYLENAFKPEAFYNWYYKDYLGVLNIELEKEKQKEAEYQQTLEVIDSSKLSKEELERQIQLYKDLNIKYKII
jgi:biotin operon repressor